MSTQSLPPPPNSFFGRADRRSLLLTKAGDTESNAGPTTHTNKHTPALTPVIWSTNASDSSFKKIQTAQNAALRTATGAHKMASIDHLDQEYLTLRVKDHSDMFSAQYPVNCLEEDHISHGIKIQEPRPMKETLHSRHHSTVLLAWLKQDGKPPESAHICGIFTYSMPRNQQSTKKVSTPNIGQGTELFESIICKHILAHLEDHKSLTNLQHCFRSVRSCETQLVTTFQDLAQMHNKTGRQIVPF